jgi:hypothetical protein
MRQQLDIEVLYIHPAEDPEYKATKPWSPPWVVRIWGGDPTKFIARHAVRGRAMAVGAQLAKVFAEGVRVGDEVLVPPVNESGQCELIVRGLDGAITERNTYPRSKDPARSKG